MKSFSHIHTGALVVIGSFLAALSLRAGFDGPYSLTPPAPGVYTGWQSPTNYGQWTARGALSMVNTSNARTRLVLEVPAHSFFANTLAFWNYAIADGTVSFDCTTVSIYPGAIAWMRQPTGTNRTTFVYLDAGPAGAPRHFDFPVQTGDLFGFSLSSGGDVVNPADPEMHTLAVENFIGPIPAPSLVMHSADVFHWQGMSNLTYTVQAKTNLDSTNWLTLGTASSANETIYFTNPVTGDPQRFYRVVFP